MNKLIKSTLFSLCLILQVHATDIEVGFSPEGTAQTLILKVINNARSSIKLSGYSFTSPVIVKSLLNAKRRGVKIEIVVDEKSNRSKNSKIALRLIKDSNIEVRTTNLYAIHHDKFIITDGENLQTGSFNYSKAAAERNSENVIVVWHNKEVANKYLRHWESRFNNGINYQ
jgi:phosphatidylserine/phosphatidylglycerophosphate/cardiolipin synthase-like enzyme